MRRRERQRGEAPNVSLFCRSGEEDPAEIFDLAKKVGEGYNSCCFVLFRFIHSCVSFRFHAQTHCFVLLLLYFSAYGSVYRAVHKSTGFVVAIKTLPAGMKVFLCEKLFFNR